MSDDLALEEEMALAGPGDFPHDFRADYSRNTCNVCEATFYGARWRPACALHQPKRAADKLWQ